MAIWDELLTTPLLLHARLHVTVEPALCLVFNVLATSVVLGYRQERKKSQGSPISIESSVRVLDDSFAAPPSECRPIEQSWRTMEVVLRT